MKHYLRYFAVFYVIALFLIGLLFNLLKIGSISYIPTLIATGFITANHFIKKENRPPSTEEKVQLVWGSTITALFILCILCFFFIVLSPASDKLLKFAENTGLALWAVIMLFFVIIHAGIFFICYGWYANFYYKKRFNRL